MTEEEKAAAEAAAKAQAEKDAADVAAAAEKAAKEKAEADAAAAAKAKTEADPAVAAATAEAEKLKAELEALKTKLADFDGIDPAVAKANAEKIEKAEAATREAEKEKAKAEGNFEKLREIQNAEHQAIVDKLQAEAATAREDAATARTEANSTRIAAAFGNSKFIAEETILSGPKAQRLFSDHVEVEDGQVVVYDKPAGSKGRAKVMDSKGNPIAFNDAIAKVIGADPDKDSLLKSKTIPGPGSKTKDGKAADTSADRKTRLAQGLKALREGRR